MTESPLSEIRLLIIEDHQVVRSGLQMLIENAGITVVGVAGDRNEALELAAQKKPNLILLDVNLSGEDGLALLPELFETADGARVLVLTGINDAEMHRRAVRMGALGVVLKDQAADVLLKALKKVHAGEAWLDRATVGDLFSEMGRRGSQQPDPDEERIKSLSEREHQVIALIAEGLRNKQIADKLFISETTVTHHLSSIFSKLAVADRLELVIYAFSHSLARLPKKSKSGP